MRARLHIVSGALAGRRVALQEGKALTVGRSARADVVVGNDEQMAAVHFALSWDGAGCRIRDLSRRGTELDGKVVSEAAVPSGGWIRAGSTGFLLRLASEDLRAGLPPPPARWQPPGPDLLTARAAALQTLRAEAQETQLFAVLDAARDGRIKALVDTCEDETRSLLDGPQGELLADGAPYLVRFERGSALLPVLVEEGWGDGWGAYLTSARPFAEVRRRLRRSLLVLDEGSQRTLYFRFYDPRVLLPFWGTCSAGQLHQVLGLEIDAFLLEGREGQVVRLSQEAAC